MKIKIGIFVAALFIMPSLYAGQGVQISVINKSGVALNSEVSYNRCMKNTEVFHNKPLPNRGSITGYHEPQGGLFICSSLTSTMHHFKINLYNNNGQSIGNVHVYGDDVCDGVREAFHSEMSYPYRVRITGGGACGKDKFPKYKIRVYKSA